MHSERLNRGQLITLIILIILTACTFGRTYFNTFLGIDDHVYVWDNPYIRDGLTIEGVSWAFRAGLTEASMFADYWQPMTFISRMIDISLFGLNAGMHHLVNLLLHLLNVLLLYLLIWHISKQSRLSFFVAALFALHPLQAEVIGWTTARKDVLSVFFGLMTIHIYTRMKHSRSFWKNILLIISFALSLMAKPMMITLPILLLLIDAWQMEVQNEPWTLKKWWSLCLNKWPLFLMIACYLPIPFIGQPQALEFELNHPAARGIAAYGFYICKLLLPVNLSLYGPIPESPLPLWQILLPAAFISITTWIVWQHRKRHIIFLIGWLWFLCACLPIISLPIADRFMYMPMIGFWLIVLSVLEKLFWNKKVLMCILGSILVFFMVQSFRQVAVWKDDETVLQRALTYSSENYAAHNVLGVVYGKQDNFPLAIKHLEEAIRIKPSRDKPYNNIGMILEKQGRSDEALEYYEKSLSLRPNDFRTVNNIAIIHVRGGRTKEGIKYFERAIRLSPKVTSIQNNLAIAYFKDGNIKKAEQIARQNKSSTLYNQFGLFMRDAGDVSSARQYFEEALLVDPSHQGAKDNLKRLPELQPSK